MRVTLVATAAVVLATCLIQTFLCPVGAQVKFALNEPHQEIDGQPEGTLQDVLQELRELRSIQQRQTAEITELRLQMASDSALVRQLTNDTGRLLGDSANVQRLMELLQPVCSGHPNIRLADGTSHEGRLEVKIGSTWGTVCSDHFANVDAVVACKTLGFRYGGKLTRNRFGRVSDSVPIHFDDVACVGSEASLFNCPRSTSGHNCNHDEDVTISCL